MTREEFNKELNTSDKKEERISWLYHKAEENLKYFQINSITFVTL
jgi:hypothetical protein